MDPAQFAKRFEDHAHDDLNLRHDADPAAKIWIGTIDTDTGDKRLVGFAVGKLLRPEGHRVLGIRFATAPNTSVNDQDIEFATRVEQTGSLGDGTQLLLAHMPESSDGEAEKYSVAMAPNMLLAVNSQSIRDVPGVH